MRTAAATPWDGRNLATLLPLIDQGSDCYLGTLSDSNRNSRLYGGQLLGQALWAAAQTAPADRRAHMLQGMFLRGAVIDQGSRFEVQRLIEGARYSSRHVRVSQSERFTLDAQVSFQVPVESPLQHRRSAMPVPEPEDLLEVHEWIRTRSGRDDVSLPLTDKFCVEMRPVAPERIVFSNNAEPRLQYWLKLREPLPDSPALHDAALAYLTDYLINFSAYCQATGLADVAQYYVVSLNHGLWFHENARVDDWLLFDTESPASGHERGLSIVQVFDRQRRLLATATQQCTLSQRRFG